MVDLGEGLRAFVMTALMLDRDGRDYPQGLVPDVPVAQDGAKAAAAASLASLRGGR